MKKNFAYGFIFFLLLTGIWGVHKESGEGFFFSSKASFADPGPTSGERKVLDLVNQEREIENLPPLTWNNKLFAAARSHSEDMAQRDYISHESPEGETFNERILAAGYDYNASGENIAAGQSSPETVMSNWMSSPEHRANILNNSFCEIGVGYAYENESKYGHYWTQKFGRQQGITVCPDPS